MAVRHAYIDGNNNVYEIGDQLAYVPITPERSSSGTYTGGEPGAVVLAGEQRAHLIELLDRIAADTAHVLASRPMGCGTVIRGDTTTFVAASSPLKAALERELRALLARS